MKVPNLAMVLALVGLFGSKSFAQVDYTPTVVFENEFFRVYSEPTFLQESVTELVATKIILESTNPDIELVTFSEVNTTGDLLQQEFPGILVSTTPTLASIADAWEWVSFDSHLVRFMLVIVSF